MDDIGQDVADAIRWVIERQVPSPEGQERLKRCAHHLARAIEDWCPVTLFMPSQGDFRVAKAYGPIGVRPEEE